MTPANFCVHCGTPVSGPFCTTCGRPIAAPSAASDVDAASAPVARPPHLPRAVDPRDTVSASLLSTGPSRRDLTFETWFVMIAFLIPVVSSAIIVLAQHVSGVADIARFPTIVSNPVWNMVLGIFQYLSIGTLVPVALFLLARTGQPPRALGLGKPTLTGDLGPALGLAVGGFLLELALLIPLEPLVKAHPGLISKISITHVPAYYVIWGLALSAITSVTEEVFMNGYFLTRLDQLGWSPRPALLLSLALRTSYHVYYGIGFLFTIPLGYLLTRSFQKHGRLSRVIAAHFIYDAVLTTISILT